MTSTSVTATETVRLCACCYGSFDDVCRDCGALGQIQATPAQQQALGDAVELVARRLYTHKYADLSPAQQHTARRILIMSGFSMQAL